MTDKPDLPRALREAEHICARKRPGHITLLRAFDEQHNIARALLAMRDERDAVRKVAAEEADKVGQLRAAIAEKDAALRAARAVTEPEGAVATTAIIDQALSPSAGEEYRRVVEALQALGAMPDGYCFCFGSGDRDPDKAEHQPECRDARDALAAYEGGQPKVAPPMDPQQDELRRLRSALGACERYAHRMMHDAGHSLDRENAKAIVRVCRQTLSNGSDLDTGGQGRG